MKALIPLLLVSSSALAVTTFQYAQRAGAERKRAEEAEALVQKHEVKIRELQLAQNNLQQQFQQAQVAAPPAAVEQGATLAKVTGPAPKRALQERAVAVLSRANTANAIAVASPFSATPWQPREMSPAAQRYMKYQMKVGMRRQYDDLGYALGLSQEQASKMIDLVVEQQTRGMGEMRRPGADMNQLVKNAQDMKARNDAEIAALIGQDRIAQWDEYQRTMGERSQVNMVRDQMEAAGTPLTNDQRQQLLDVFVQQTRAMPRPQLNQGVPPDEMFAQSMKWQDESERAMLDGAKSILTPQQFDHYKDYAEWQSEMRRNAMANFRAPPPVNGAQLGTANAVSSYMIAEPAAPSAK